MARKVRNAGLPKPSAVLLAGAESRRVVRWSTLRRRNLKQIADIQQNILDVVMSGQHDRVRDMFKELKKLHEANGAGCQHPVTPRCGMDSVCDACGAYV